MADTPQQYDPQEWLKRSPFNAAMLGVSDPEAAPPPEHPQNRTEDEMTAGRRGGTPTGNSPNQGRVDTMVGPSAAQQYLQSRIQQNQREYDRLTAPPPPLSLKQKILQGLGGALQGAAVGPQMEATLRDRNVARKQQERENIRGAIDTDTRTLATEQMAEAGLNERARLQREAEDARAQIAANAQAGQTQRNTDTLANRTANTQTQVEGRADVAQARLDSQEQRDAADRAMKLQIATARDAVMRETAQLRANTANSALAPQLKKQAQTAQSLIPMIDRLSGQTADVAGQLGPGIGRWNQFMTGTVGAPNPQFANYMAQMTFLESAVTLAHSQGRVSNLIFEQFQKLYAAGKQSPENMQQFLAATREWMVQYASMLQQAHNAPTPTDSNSKPAPITLDQLMKQDRQRSQVPF